MKTKIILACLLVSFTLHSCASKKSVPAAKKARTYTMYLNVVDNPVANKYANMDYGIRLIVNDSRTNKSFIQTYNAKMKNATTINTTPGIGNFISESARAYMRTLGFTMDADIATDYTLQMDIKDFHIDYLSGIGWQGTVVMNISVRDNNRALVYPGVEVVGRESMNATAESFNSANMVINKAYSNALKNIDWDRIAYFLHRANSPKQEANKKVTGDGSTALEHLVVHWNVNSRPQGADVFWRVISKTQDVKSQNYRYLETTPYEGNETLNIKGLTYNNAGLVQIEIKVEKEGYYSQTKKYDVLSLIDDNEVSYMFRLVKEEE